MHVLFVTKNSLHHHSYTGITTTKLYYSQSMANRLSIFNLSIYRISVVVCIIIISRFLTIASIISVAIFRAGYCPYLYSVIIILLKYLLPE